MAEVILCDPPIKFPQIIHYVSPMLHLAIALLAWLLQSLELTSNTIVAGQFQMFAQDPLF